MVKLYVEGGGDSAALKMECRRGFSEFLRNAKLAGHMPRIVACGSRQNAFDSFRTALENNEESFLLVDSEAPVSPDCQHGECQGWRPWRHLFLQDKWSKPAGAEENHCHLMTQVMESWFLADRAALAQFFGPEFQEAKLPASDRVVEEIGKDAVVRGLRDATGECGNKNVYDKGRHSFKILALLAPAKVLAQCPWAERLVETLRGNLS